MIDIPHQLFTSFNNITYHDDVHKYYHDNGKQFTSVTTLLHKYASPFEEEYWSEYKGDQHGIPSKDVLNGWQFMNDVATYKGSAIHDYAENKFLNKVFPYPEEKIKARFGYDPVKPLFDANKKQVDGFYDKVKNKLIPIRTELIVYDEKSMISGMVDLLVYNIKYKEFQIWDYKTNKAYRKVDDAKYKMTGILGHLYDCEHTIYSLQLSLYKYIIEKITGLKLGKSYLVWFHQDNPSYQIIEADDMSTDIKKVVGEHQIQLLNAA